MGFFNRANNQNKGGREADNNYEKRTVDFGDDDYDKGAYDGAEDDGVVDTADDGKDLYAPPAPQRRPAPAAAGSLKTVKPQGIEDCFTIAEHLIRGYTVVMSIESLSREVIIRLLDFLQGALYALGGELKRVSKNTFVLTPRKGQFSDDGESAAPSEYGKDEVDNWQ